ncbi:Aminotransferase class I and II [Fragilaria crotonensis]|nr:Aminotransferase class I and II [Fragilaria crotonensis]
MAEEKKSEHGQGVAARLARPNILELQPYRCARDDYSEGILLDANENAIGPTSVPTNSLDPYDNHLNLERYPDPYQFALKESFAAYRGNGLTPANIFVGVGSDEAIDLLMRIFCRPAVDNILIAPPTYGMYKVCAKVNDVEIISSPLSKDFDLRVPETLEAANARTKLLFICSPGNPTCKAIPLSEIEKVAASSQYGGLVVVDEAYVDFSDKGTAISLIHKYPNIVVLQTLSKAFGLAGIRCGFAIGSPDVIQLMNNVKAPYNVNSMTSEVAINALNSIDVLEKNVATLLSQRAVVAERLAALDFVVEVFPSDANFILFRMKSKAQEVYTLMADNGVVTRYRGSELHCSECLRVTIGTEDENEKFLTLLVETWAKVN